MFEDKAYVLHCQPYKETSAILRLMTNTQGVLSGVIKGVYGKNKQAASLRSCLQIGNLIEFQWSGNSSLKNIYQIELAQITSLNSTQKFICLSYINELVLYFLQEQQCESSVFNDYSVFIKNILEADLIEPALRRFEFSLLRNLGYGLDFSCDMDTQAQVKADSYYKIIPGEGVRLAEAATSPIFLGNELLLLHNEEYQNPLLFIVAKKISRLLLEYYLEGKTIKSRQLYKEMFVNN